jgi:hypothetical protein
MGRGGKGAKGEDKQGDGALGATSIPVANNCIQFTRGPNTATPVPAFGAVASMRLPIVFKTRSLVRACTHLSRQFVYSARPPPAKSGVRDADGLTEVRSGEASSRLSEVRRCPLGLRSPDGAFESPGKKGVAEADDGCSSW